MNIYQVNVEPKAVPGTGLGGIGCGRNFTVVTDTLQDAMSIARGHVDNNKETITGVYVISTDTIVDYSHIVAGN